MKGGRGKRRSRGRMEGGRGRSRGRMEGGRGRRRGKRRGGRRERIERGISKKCQSGVGREEE